MARKLSFLILCITLTLCAVAMTASASSVERGQEFYLGAYEQDNQSGNGPEPICWIVLDVNEQAQTALVTTKYGLEVMSYHRNQKQTAWKDSDIRAWLNEEFYYDAFLGYERDMIVETKASGSNDMVFLLDARQVQDNFRSYLLSATAYARRKGAYYANDNGSSPWWVRTDSTAKYASFVGAHGKIYSSNNPPTAKDNLVRPAMHVTFAAILGAEAETETGVWGVNNRTIFTRSGPSTQYDELGGYFDNSPGHAVYVVSRAADNNGLWWYQCEFEHGDKKVRVYTGHFRIDVNMHAIPVEGSPIGYGALTADATAYYGPGTDFKTHREKIPFGTDGDVLCVEDGFVCFEFRDGKIPRRVWIEEDCVGWFGY